ncbi:hypothetical protein M2451_001853, partial [Dysgonomonas sp. PFB1-18]|uniref:phage head spike fiber domain-containing protein n=1 Tax=Dysgonomonas sp. PFB1-18 TaxID=2940633 RepID=UPI0024746FE0
YFIRGVRLYRPSEGAKNYLQSIAGLAVDTYTQSNFAMALDGSPVITGVSNSANAHYSYNSNAHTEKLVNNDVYRTSATYANTGAIRWFGLYKYQTNNADDVIVSGFQVELGDTPTSYIPTSTTAATRAADLLSYNLPVACSVYMKTTKQNVVLDKTAGTWNIDQDLNNEGILYLAVFDRILTDNEKASLTA